jgi:hypothetical protein
MYTKIQQEPGIIRTGITAVAILVILIIGILGIPITILKEKLK